MGIGVFQNAPFDACLRCAILLNTLSFFLLVFAFGFSFRMDSSAVTLVADFYHRDSTRAFAQVSPLYVRNSAGDILCPDSEAANRTLIQGVASFAACDQFRAASQASLALDAIAIVALIVLHFLQRDVTTRVRDSISLARWFFCMQLVPLLIHVLARIIFDAVAVSQAATFVRTQGLSNAAVPMANTAVEIGAVQKVHITVAALLGGALALTGVRMFQAQAEARIDSVELTRECATRLRQDEPGKHPPLRWMLDTENHPLYDDDELATIRASQPSPQLLAEIDAATEVWHAQQLEREREGDALRRYSHIIRREERIMSSIVVDDWSRQTDILAQRKEAVVHATQYFAGRPRTKDATAATAAASPFADAPPTPTVAPPLTVAPAAVVGA